VDKAYFQTEIPLALVFAEHFMAVFNKNGTLKLLKLPT
jgi:hypothetical protein